MRKVSVLSDVISSSASSMNQHTGYENDEGKVQMESDKFLVEIFLPEGDKRCCNSNADRKSLSTL